MSISMARSILLAVILLVGGCGPRFAGKPCRPLPLPDAESFEHCGGMIYRSGAGASANYTIRFVNKVPAKFELADVCVLLDDAPVFTQKEVDAYLSKSSSEPAAWSGKIAHVRHTVLVQITYRTHKKDEEAGASPSDRIVLRAALEVAPAGGAELELTAVDKGAGTAESRLALEATLPAGTAQPRCE